jgi:hydrogenase nickel incorporation protein HypB
MIARANRDRLRRHGICAVHFIGGAGCGKTSLVRATAESLPADVRTAIIIADAAPGDAQSLGEFTDQVVRVNTNQGCCLSAIHLRDALDRFDLDNIDLLLIENVSSLSGPPCQDLGESLRVAVLSLAAGDEQLDAGRDAVAWADAVILNKTDLLGLFCFDLHAFRDRLLRIKPDITHFELSLHRGEGIGDWIRFLRRHSDSRWHKRPTLVNRPA